MLKFKTWGKISIVLDEFVQYTAINKKSLRSQHVELVGLENTMVLTNYAPKSLHTLLQQGWHAAFNSQPRHLKN